MLKLRMYAIKVFLDCLKIFVHLVVKYVKYVDDIPVCLYDINLPSYVVMDLPPECGSTYCERISKKILVICTGMHYVPGT